MTTPAEAAYLAWVNGCEYITFKKFDDLNPNDKLLWTAIADAVIEQSKTIKEARFAASALEAVLLFYSASSWTETNKTQWWNLTQTNEATTRNLCDTVRLALGRLPSCFGDFTGRLPTEIPSDMRLSHEQRNALERLASNCQL